MPLHHQSRWTGAIFLIMTTTGTWISTMSSSTSSIPPRNPAFWRAGTPVYRYRTTCHQPLLRAWIPERNGGTQRGNIYPNELLPLVGQIGSEGKVYSGLSAVRIGAGIRPIAEVWGCYLAKRRRFPYHPPPDRWSSG